MTDEIQTNDTPDTNTETDEGMVAVYDASIQDLDAALASAEAEEAEQESAAAVSSEDVEATAESAATPPANQEPTEQLGVTAKAATPGVAAPGADPSKPVVDAPQRTYTQDEIQGIIAENERRKAEGDQKELFIKRRESEYGELKRNLDIERREKLALKAQLENGLEDRFSENPLKASNDRDLIKKIDQEIEVLDQNQERAENITQAQTLFLRNVDTKKVSIEDMAETLKAGGVDERYVAQFKANPWEWTTPEALVEIGKRAEIRKDYLRAHDDRVILAKQVIAQKAMIDKLQNRTKTVMSQVQKNLNKSPSLTSASSATARTAKEVDPARMSTAEIDAALQHAMRSEMH